MTLGNDLGMNFFIPKAELTGTDYYAVITMYYSDDREPAAVTLPLDEWTNYSSVYYRISFNGIAAKEMSDSLVVEVFNGEDQAVSVPYTDGIRTYIMRNIDKTTFNAKQKIWAVDCLNYGAAAQIAFTYNTDDLANNQLTEAHKALATAEVTMENNQDKGAHGAGTTLVLETNIALTAFFDGITNKEGMYATISFMSHNAEEGDAPTVKTVYADAFIQRTSTMYGVLVDNMVVADARQLITITMYNADGTVYSTFVESVESYCARIGGDLNIAIMKFATSAYNIFH